MVYAEVTPHKGAALRREKQIKKYKQEQKIALVSSEDNIIEIPFTFKGTSMKGKVKDGAWFKSSYLESETMSSAEAKEASQ